MFRYYIYIIRYIFFSITSFYAFLCNFVSGMLFVTSTEVLFLMHSDKCCLLIVSCIVSTAELELLFAALFHVLSHSFTLFLPCV